MQIQREALSAKKGCEVVRNRPLLLNKSKRFMFVIHLQIDVGSAGKIAMNNNNAPFMLN